MKKILSLLLAISLLIIMLGQAMAVGDGPACERAKKAWWHPGIVGGCLREIAAEIWLDNGLRGRGGG